MFTAAFWTATAERALKTFAQTFVALVGTDVANVVSMNVGDKLIAAAVAAVLSVLTSVGSSKVGTAGPSLANETVEF